MYPTTDRADSGRVLTGAKPAGIPVRHGIPVHHGLPVRHGIPVHVTPGFCLLLAWFAAVQGWGPLLLILCAAAFHEAGHLLALRLFGGTDTGRHNGADTWRRRGIIRGLRVSVQGAALDIDSSRLSYGRELLCVLAGPAASLLLAFLAVRLAWDALAGASLLLGLYNLLPVRPLDGGRMVELALSRLTGPREGERAARWCGGLCALALAGVTAWLVARSVGNLWLLPPLAGFLSAAVREIRGESGER